MKKILLAVSVIFLLILPVFLYAQEKAENQITVYFTSGVQRNASVKNTSVISSTKISALFAKYAVNITDIKPSFPDFKEADTVNATIGEQSRQMNRAKVFTITITDKIKKTTLLGELNKLPEVLFAEEDGTSSTNIIPVDGRFGQQWNMRNTIVPGADIHVEPAWDIFTGNPNAIIAIIDAGVDVNHNDLNTKILGGDGTFTTNTDNPARPFSHGSHVAGIAAAITNNAGNNGVAGVDWQARIHSRHVIGNGSDDATVSNAIINAVNFNPNVWTLNHSWSLTNGNDGFGNAIPGRYSTIVRSAFAHAYKNNRVSCVAMGNHQAYSGGIYANVVGFPAGFNSGQISVGATDFTDNAAVFSARGNHIDVAAPGVDIWSTNFNNGYIDLSGTSMATPHVAGLASLLKGFNTTLANDDIEQIIRLTADDVNAPFTPGFDDEMGMGRINALRALQSLQAPNTLQQLSTSGSTVFTTSGSMTRIFLGVPGFPDAAYIVKRSEIRSNVTFPSMCTIAGVWGRGIGTTGYREEQGRSFGEGICEVVPGTLTNTGCTLRTWIYEVWTTLGQYMGFYPSNAANAVLKYTILGVPTPTSISGDLQFCTTSSAYSVSGLPAAMNVTWSTNPSGIANPSCTNCPQTTLTKVSNGNITLSANVPGCLTNPTINKTVKVGSYSNYDVQISGYTMVPLNYASSYSIDQSKYPGLTNLVWSWPSPPAYNPPYAWSYVYGGGSNNFIVLRSGSAASTGDIGLNFSSCGTNNILASKWVAWGYGGPRYRVSPNPANDILRIEQIDSATNKALAQTNIQMIEIIDKMGLVAYRKTFAKGTPNGITIPVEQFRNDVYIVRIFDGKERKSYKIIIQH